MQAALLIIHLVLAIALVVVILLQRSEGGALGIGGGGGMMSIRGADSVLTRSTTYLAVAFIATSLLLAITARENLEGGSVFDDPEAAQEEVPTPQQERPVVPTPE